MSGLVRACKMGLYYGVVGPLVGCIVFVLIIGFASYILLFGQIEQVLIATFSYLILFLLFAHFFCGIPAFLTGFIAGLRNQRAQEEWYAAAIGALLSFIWVLVITNPIVLSIIFGVVGGISGYVTACLRPYFYEWFFDKPMQEVVVS